MKRYEPIYKEDAKLDNIFRKQAEKTFNKLKKIHLHKDDINLMFDEEEFNKLNLSFHQNLLVIRLNQILPKECENLYLFLSLRTKEKAGFGYEHKEGKTLYYITLNCIKSEEAKLLYTGHALPMVQHYLNQSHEEFVHEYIHYLDALRQKGGKELITLELSLDQYVNNPAEFNAFYQQGVSTLELDLKNRKKSYEGSGMFYYDILKNGNAQQFIDTLLSENDYWVKEFTDNLNDEYKRKFIKRLYGLFDFLQKKFVK